MKSQKTILAVLTRQIQFVIQKAKFPIVVSVKRPQQEVSFDGFRDMEKCLNSVAAVKINPQPIKLNVKLKNNVQTEHIDFGVVFENQSKMFSEIIEEKKQEIRERTLNQWDKRNYSIHIEKEPNHKTGRIREIMEMLLIITLLIIVITTAIIVIYLIF